MNEERNIIDVVTLTIDDKNTKHVLIQSRTILYLSDLFKSKGKKENQDFIPDTDDVLEKFQLLKEKSSDKFRIEIKYKYIDPLVDISVDF